MVYAAFSVYLLLILFMGLGIYSLWGWIASPRWLNWLLLPGTIVSEMAYIFGYLITGGEIQQAKLMGGGGGKGKTKKPDSSGGGSASSGSSGGSGGSSAEPTTKATPGVKYVSPILASLACILACGATIYYLNQEMGKAVVRHFDDGLIKSLPTTMSQFWDHLNRQLGLLKHTTDNWDGVKWRDWHAPVFVYLVMCLSIRLAPVRRSLAATMGAVVVLVGVIIVAGALWKRFDDGIATLWPLLTYMWVTLLFLLGLTLVIAGITALVRALTGKASA